MWQRIWLYLKEMYPPAPAFAMAMLSFFNLWFMLSAMHGMALQVNWPSLAGGTTLFLFLLFLRISDEFKDLEADKVLFPERLVPSGRVKESDLGVLLWLSVGLMILLNLSLSHALLAFGVLFAYGVLMYHYFFVPRLIAGNLMLALISHNPSVLLMNAYGVAVFCGFYGTAFWDPRHAWLAVIFWLPGLGWELARKIKAPEDENDYVTYSRLLGYKLAALLPMSAFSLQYLLLMRLNETLLFSMPFMILYSLLLLGLLGFFCRFILLPSAETARLKPIVEVYMLVSSVWLIMELVLQRGVLWTL